MRYFRSLFNLRLPVYLVYMLQQVEYDPKKFWAWKNELIAKNKPISRVMFRKKLVFTTRAKMLTFVLYAFAIVILSLCLLVFSAGMGWYYVIFALSIAALIIVNFLDIFLFVLASIAHKLVVCPKNRKLINEASEIFAKSKAVKIAILGSYGKTTMKEMLHTVLSEGKKVVTTPGNMNVSVSHARFAKKLTGDEEIIIVEFGEGEPGDISRMAQMLKPDYGVITGLAPNHLDRYPDISAVAADFLDIYKFVNEDKVFVSGESEMLKPYLLNNALLYTVDGLLDWKTDNIEVAINKTSFEIKSGKRKINVKTALIGRHQVAPLTCAAVIADKLGLKLDQIESGLKKTVPYEHRMRPRITNGAWVIDDTYNGNIEGMLAGLKLLRELSGKRKWYVTPGLVDQGDETERVHVELGKSIAQASPDTVVLMENSVRPIIQKALVDNGFTGQVIVENNPLEFYTNLEHKVATGDVVLMQNDWTDNYS